MGKIILTCGHEATKDDGPDGMGITLAIADQDRECNPAISYPTVCNECADWYEKGGLIVEDEDKFFQR